MHFKQTICESCPRVLHRLQYLPFFIISTESSVTGASVVDDTGGRVVGGGVVGGGGEVGGVVSFCSQAKPA